MIAKVNDVNLFAIKRFGKLWELCIVSLQMNGLHPRCFSCESMSIKKFLKGKNDD